MPASIAESIQGEGAKAGPIAALMVDFVAIVSTSWFLGGYFEAK
jgi:hypothetical protein